MGPGVIWQCAHRFEELKLTGGFPLVDHQCNMVTGRASSTPSDSVSTQPEPGGAVDPGQVILLYLGSMSMFFSPELMSEY